MIADILRKERELFDLRLRITDVGKQAQAFGHVDGGFEFRTGDRDIGVRTLADAAFRRHLDSLAAQHEQFTLHYICSRSDEARRPAGRMTPEFVIERLQGLHIVLQGHRVDLPWHESDMYLCGPGDFCCAFKDAFVARGANADHIFTELFVPATAEVTQIEEATVRFAGSDLTCVWSAREDLSLLELAERAGVAIQSDCRAGSCLTCRTAVRSGSTTADLGDGGALLCVGRPRRRAWFWTVNSTRAASPKGPLRHVQAPRI